MKTNEVLGQLDKIKVLVNSRTMTSDELIEAFNSLDSIIRGQYQLFDEYQDMIDEKKTFIDKLTHVNSLLTETSLTDKREIDDLKWKIKALEIIFVGTMFLLFFLGIYSFITSFPQFLFNGENR